MENMHTAQLNPKVKAILSGKPHFIIRWGTLLLAVIVAISLLLYVNMQRSGKIKGPSFDLSPKKIMQHEKGN